MAEVLAASAPKPAPALRLLQGNPPSAIEIKPTRPTLVHFWATWCAPCVDELPALVKSSETLRKAGFDLVIVSVDAGATSKVPPFLTKLGLPDTKVYWDPRSDLYKKFAISMLPTTVVINARGEEVGRITGAANWSGERDARLLASRLSR